MKDEICLSKLIEYFIKKVKEDEPKLTDEQIIERHLPFLEDMNEQLQKCKNHEDGCHILNKYIKVMEEQGDGNYKQKIRKTIEAISKNYNISILKSSWLTIVSKTMNCVREDLIMILGIFLIHLETVLEIFREAKQNQIVESVKEELKDEK